MDQISYNRFQTITPDDAVTGDFALGVADAVYVGGAGTVTVVLQNGTTQQFTATAGLYLRASCKRVNSTGTAATNMVACYRV
jgi:hypothetical protein